MSIYLLLSRGLLVYLVVVVMNAAMPRHCQEQSSPADFTSLERVVCPAFAIAIATILCMRMMQLIYFAAKICPRRRLRAD